MRYFGIPLAMPKAPNPTALTATVVTMGAATLEVTIAIPRLACFVVSTVGLKKNYFDQIFFKISKNKRIALGCHKYLI
jgi:hypothetical protein